MSVAVKSWKGAITVLKKIVFLIVVCVSSMLWANASFAQSPIASGNSAYPPLHLNVSGHLSEQVRHGEYLVKMADCFTCHTNEADGGKAFAGGLKINTPFGSLYASNITPDKATGIGQWSDQQFVRAVREGIAPDGSYYYPVMPYNYYNKMSVQDVLDIKAYLDAIPAVRKQNHRQALKWPFNYRFLQFGWRLLFFDFNKGAYKVNASHSKAWNRGKFIVEGPGHCALCHTKLNYFGVPIKRYLLAGNFIEDYYAPNITSKGLKLLTDEDVANIFRHNEMPTHSKLGGPMRDVEHNSLRYLSKADTLGIGHYLKSIQSESPPIEVDINHAFTQADGRKLYQSNCEMCHGNHVMGAPSINQRVWDILQGQGLNKLYEVAIRGDGNMPAKGGCDICANGRVKAAVDYMIFLSKLKQPAKVSGAAVN
ncbi:MAG: c-type cytochrome [Mariprofundaceae bacterium]|nr:c-type cytochrome [Mariprofundaceae bacterium]